jgi:DNA-binding GntR family transcriptional regulator
LKESLQRGSLPLHESIREEIIKRIKSGTYKAEEPIPSMVVLTAEFGVSPITIKRALRDLQSAGALIAIPGKGTYVKKQRRVVRRLDIATPSWEDTTIQLLSITREKITDPTLRTFNPPAGAMLCVHKTILVDGTPLMYDASYLSSDVKDEVVQEFGQHFIKAALERHGIRIVNTDLIIDAASAEGKVEEIFGIPSGYPILRRFYKLTTTDPAITIFGVIQAPFDQLACSISIPASGKSKPSRRGG